MRWCEEILLLNGALNGNNEMYTLNMTLNGNKFNGAMEKSYNIEFT
jgi:hypothetical protein